jgi:urease accessory protein
MNLRLLQITDSALPIGGYTHSWGLEAALFRKLVHDAASLETWTRCWLRHSLAPLEGVLAASACRFAIASTDLKRLNGMLHAMLPVPSIRTASVEMGEQLLSLAATWEWSAGGIRILGDGRGWHHAVVYGLLGAIAGATPQATLTAYFHQAALGMIGAGVRAVPINHTHGQQILAYLHSEIEELAEVMADRAPETAGSGNPFYEVLCDEQTRLYSRMYRS